MTTLTNQAFLKIARRAETNERSKLVATFVDWGPVFALLSSRDHQVVYGRRGTGKTHLLSYLASQVEAAGDVAILLDLRTVGSNWGVYNDESLSISERATRLLIDIFGAIYNGVLEHIVNRESKEADQLLSIAGPHLDRLASEISEVRVINTQTTHTIRFGSIGKIMGDLVAVYKTARIWVMFDEWSSLPVVLQPFLADLIRRTLLPVQGVTVKIAAIEQRSNFRQNLDDGEYIGIELGADMAADVNLDDLMAFDNDPNAAKQFFRDLLHKQYTELDDPDFTLPAKTPDELIHDSFTQQSAFEEYVRSVEGVPRDAINILNFAAQRAADEKISINHIRSAAKAWYERDKERAVESKENAHELLLWIIAEVIDQRQARAFLLRKDAKHELIDYLFDSRLLHILKRSVSARDQPGVRFVVYKLDYGCYVDLVNTSRQPQGLIPQDDAEFINVPVDDYRSIRRAILDIDEFGKHLAMGAPSK